MAFNYPVRQINLSSFNHGKFQNTFFAKILSLGSVKGFRIKELEFLLYVRRVNIGLGDLWSVAPTPNE
jgi:hypothetical protein